MSISKSIIDRFAKIINSGKEPEKEVYFYGEVVMNNGVKCVLLDGSDIYTPIDEVTDAQPGDRVMVLLNNHTATVVGNQTCPASARTASSFIEVQEETMTVNGEEVKKNHLIIGDLTKGGTKNKLSSDGQRIYDEIGKELAAFLSDKIKLGQSEISSKTNDIGNSQTKEVLSLQNKDGSIGISFDKKKSNNNAQHVAGQISLYEDSDEPNILLRVEDYNLSGSGDGPYIKSLRSSAGLKLALDGLTFDCGNDSFSSSMNIKHNVLNISYIKDRNVSPHDEVMVSIDAINGVRINNAKVYTDNSPIFKTGSSTVTCANGSYTSTGTTSVSVTNATASSNGYILFDVTPDIPSGYTIVGLPRIQSNHTNALQLTSYWINNNNTVYVWFHNAGSSSISDTTLQLNWFAVKSSNLN